MEELDTESPDFDQLILDAIMARPNGDILNIMQAARELPGPLFDRLQGAYREITGNDGHPDDIIKLKGDD